MIFAVVTDAVSAEFFFPIWYRYYSAQVGPQNMYVVTYRESQEEFNDFELGGIEPLPQSYDEDLRWDKISEFVRTLLDDHDIVLRVDVDEFLVPDPDKYSSLMNFLSGWKGEYLTALGFDLIQSPDEPILDFAKSVLSQRRYAYALTAMNKTCVTRKPLKWGRGFHYCSSPPQFGDLYLLHTKRADIRMQKDWNDCMREHASDDPFVQKYYSWQQEQINLYHSNRFTLPLIEGEASMVRIEFNASFLSQIGYNESNGLYEGTGSTSGGEAFDIEQVNVRIPDKFRSLF
jgi:hypothetical protein